jgi:putative copper resistance protein D
MSPDIASALLRSLAFVLLFQAAGSVFFASLVSELLDRSAGTMRRLQLWSSLLAIVALLLHLELEPARLAGGYAGMLDPALQSMVMATSSARTHAMQVIGLAAIALGSLGAARGYRVVAAVGAVATLAAFLMTGHTSTHEWRAELAPFLLVHVLIIAFWFGSMLPMYAMLRLESGAVAAAALMRFSSKAVWLVPFVAVAGVRLLLTIANGLPDFRAPYGGLMLAKIAGFALLIGLAAWNKVILVPAVVAARPGARALLQWSILVEVMLLVAVLSITAVMTSFYSP